MCPPMLRPCAMAGWHRHRPVKSATFGSGGLAGLFTRIFWLFARYSLLSGAVSQSEGRRGCSSAHHHSIVMPARNRWFSSARRCRARAGGIEKRELRPRLRITARPTLTREHRGTQTCWRCMDRPEASQPGALSCSPSGRCGGGDVQGNPGEWG